MLFNARIPTELQLLPWTCSIRATTWCLKSIGIDVSAEQLHDLMVPGLVTEQFGLLNASGAGIAELLREHWGLAADHQSVVDFDEVAARAGQQPVAIGGRNWGGPGLGHWSAVRGVDPDGRLQLANPAGTGPRFGQQTLGHEQFAIMGPFSAVWIELESPMEEPTEGSTEEPTSVGHPYLVTNTEGAGLRLREGPGTGAAIIGSVAEGELVDGDEFAWREISEPEGLSGWAADEFLSPQDGQFVVAGLDGSSLNVREGPDLEATIVGTLPEGTLVEGGDHAWRHVRVGGAVGWVASEFLSAA